MGRYPLRPLSGSFELTIDDKNRLLIPADVRKVIDPEKDGQGFFMVPGVNRRLWLYPDKQYEALAQRMESELAPDGDRLSFDMLNYSLATRVDWDHEGRILIADKVLRKANLGKEVTLLGVRDHIEIWNRADWAAFEEELEQRRPEIAHRAKQANVGSATAQR